MTIEQKKIFDNLNLIGATVANFYHDALILINSDIQLSSKANLIAHLAREIDGSLRDVFAPSSLSKKDDEGCKQKDSHLNSILLAIDKTDKDDKFAQNWREIASSFHRIAHRKDIHKDSKDPKEIIALWSRYEKILDVVIGSFLALTSRLDVVLKLDVPDKQLLSSFNNIISKPKSANYLFSNLNKPLWLKNLSDIGVFDPTNAPVQKDENSFPDYWYQIKFLLNISAEVRRNVESNLITIVKNILDAYVQEKLKLHPYVISDLSEIILKIESMKFSNDEFNFYEKVSMQIHPNYWGLIHEKLIKGLPKKLIVKEDRFSLLLLLKYFLGVRFVKVSDEKNIFEIDSHGSKKTFNIDKYSLKNLISIHGNDIVIYLGKELFDIVIDSIKKIHINSPYSISSLSISSIEVSSQSIYEEKIEGVLVNFIRDFGFNLVEKEFTELINELVFSDVEILNRLGIHLIRVNFDNYKEIWWKYVSSSDNSKKLCIHEPYLLLKEHANSFNEVEVKSIISWIEKMNFHSDKIHIAYNIRRWLTAFDDISMPCKSFVQDTKAKYEKINSATMTEHPEFDSYFSFGLVEEPPISFEDFNQLDITSQITYIKNLKSDDGFNDHQESVAKLLQSAIEENPNKYLLQLNDFSKTNSLYQYHIINAFLNLLKQNKSSDYLIVINYIEFLISENNFSSERNKFDYYSWLLSIIIDYIKHTLQNGRNFNIGNYELNILLQLLIKLNELCKNENTIPQNGYINHLLNSNKGKLYDALIESAKLNSLLFENFDYGKSLPQTIIDLFTYKLNDPNFDLEFSIAISTHLPVLFYLDKAWVEKHISIIFDDSEIEKYNCRIACVFTRLFTFNKDYIIFLKKYNLFDKGIQLFKNSSDSLDTLTYYSILEWKLLEIDLNSDSIVSKIILNGEAEQIKSLLFSAINSRLLSQEDILKLWKLLFDKFETDTRLKNSYPILNILFNGLNYINEDNIFLLRELVLHINIDVDAHNFLRHLYKLADTNLAMAGELLLQIFQKGIVQPFFEDELFSIVEKIYNSKNFELANMICVEVSETGFLNLKQLYNHHN